MTKQQKWGFLRETQAKAMTKGVDKVTEISLTGLDKYLKVIFPGVDDWIHDKSIKKINGKKCSFRPDFRSESLKMIIEFDGLLHYTNPQNILADIKKTALYKGGGYKVVRIPYFIQLTNAVVKKMFGVDVKEPLFDDTIPSMHVAWKNTPAYVCCMGVERMAKELSDYPDQLKVNMDALKEDSLSSDGKLLSGYDLLQDAVERIKDSKS